MSDPDKLICEYYQSWFRFHPEVAVDTGVEGYAHLLTPCDDDDLGALTALNEMLLSALEEFNQQDLDEDQRLDFDIMRSAALLELKELVEQDWRQRDPLRFLPVHAIYQLTLREVQDPSAAFSARLSAIPGHLRSARSHLQVDPVQIPPNWLQVAIVEAEEGAAYLRHEIPFAAYLEPARNDSRQQGLYYVTLPETDTEVGEHNAISLRHTCVHKAWPGHHLQFVTANGRPQSSTLPRLLNPSATLYEGWALYCEQMMQEQGFLDAPESRFVLLQDRLWRALRIMLDVELHTRGLNLELASERMQLWLGFSPEQAMEVDFTLRAFHDRLLSMGSVPVAKVIPRVFGEPLWKSVRKEVLFQGV